MRLLIQVFFDVRYWISNVVIMAGYSPRLYRLGS